MTLWIAGMGTAVPAHSIAQEDAAVMARSLCVEAATRDRALPKLYRACGVRARHSVLLRSSTNGEPARQQFYAEAHDEADRGPTTGERMRVYEAAAAPLAVAAASRAFAAAGTSPSEVTHLVTVSCSGFSAPGFDLALVRKMAIPSSVARTHIGFMGCHGALNGLRVAKAFVDAEPRACVLLCAVELCSLHYHYGPDVETILANALFADGAAAIVARGSPAADQADWRLETCGSTILPEFAELMRWSIRDHGFEMSLSREVPDVIRQHVRPWLETWLAQQRLSIEQIGSWAIHPGGPRILTACGEAMGIDPAQLRPAQEVLAKYGNMSSATVLFVLELLRRRDAARPCVALGFGPGLAFEAALFR